MKRTVTITVTYEDHDNPVSDSHWAYTLRMGGLDVDDEDVRVRRRLGSKPSVEPRVHFVARMMSDYRMACGRARLDLKTTSRHEAVTCLSCISAIANFPAAYPDGGD